MLIRINKSQLFYTHPARRFAQEYGVSEAMWHEIWKRHKLLSYTHKDLAEYVTFKSGKNIRSRQMKRWLFLGEIYVLTKPARDMGAQVVNSNIFGDLEQKVILELTRHIKSGSQKDCRTLA